MFGLRLKSWMEAHLGRPRHKSTTHQSQKRSSKDTSTNSTPTATAAAVIVATATSSLSSSSPTPVSSQQQQQQPHLNSGDPLSIIKNSNLDSITSFCSTNIVPCPVNFPSTVNGGGGGQVNSSSLAVSGRAQEHDPLADLSDEASHHLQHQPNRNSIVTVSNSNSILLGSFSNNLSSPDTGYSSTDGYSPKSVYPALSFESSGKSTPKSSYTISSLVSSELLNKNTPSPSQSQSFSVQNGSEQDECISPVNNSCPVLLDQRPEGAPAFSTTSSSSLPIQGHSQSNSNSYNDSTNSHHSSSCAADVLGTHDKSNQIVPVIVQDGIPSTTNDNQQTISDINKANRNHREHHTFSSSHLPPTIVISMSRPGGAPPPPPPTQTAPTPKKRMPEDLDFASHCSPIINSTNHHSISPENNRRRVETMEEQEELSQIANSSSSVTARSIRTSVVLSSAASASAVSHIPDCNLGAMKNSFSLCSPRRERTRIKTNPWITISHHNDSNSHANTSASSEISCKTLTNSDMDKTGVSSNDSSSGSRVPPVPLSDTGDHTGITLNNGVVGGAPGSLPFPEMISGKGDAEADCKVHDTANLLYRISTSTSASDSGKGTLEPGTNRNSAESSCLLSDSATSTRNSIISHENGSPSNSSGSGNNVSSKSTQGHDDCVAFKSPYHPHQQSSPQNSANLSIKTTPICLKKSSRESSAIEELKSEDNTQTSTTTFGELIGKYDGSSYTNMVDKETDILSDWANTDEDGEDDIETDHNDTVTPTPSSPDTGARIVLTTSQSNSSATDFDIEHSSLARTHRHYAQNINKRSNSGVCIVVPSVAHPTPYNHNMNLPTTTTTCYPYSGHGSGVHANQIPLQIPVTEIPNAYSYQYDTLLNLNQSELTIGNPGLSSPPTDAAAALKTARCFNARIPNASPPLPSSPKESQPGPSHAIARGALGFLRKIFKKGSCSSQRTSPGSGKVKMSRSRTNNSNNISSIVENSNSVLRSPLLVADNVNNYSLLSTAKPLSPAINGYFLTPTPNSFRRRSGTGTDSSDSRSSKQHKGIKTDIIRLPTPIFLHSQSTNQKQTDAAALAQQQSFSSTSSTSTTNPSRSSDGNANNNNNNGASSFLTTNFHPGTHNTNTNTNSTTGSSVHSMSTSTSASGGAAAAHNVSQNQMRPNETSHHSNLKQSVSSCASSIQSPFMSGQRSTPLNNVNNDKSINGNFNTNGNIPHTLMMSNGSSTSCGSNGKLVSCATATVTSQCQAHSQSASIQQLHSSQSRDILPPPPTVPSPSPKIILGGGCSHDSPRLPNSTRINSPSFNNYSPIHRLVVTGANHLLSQRANAPSTTGPPSSFHTESPLLISRNGNVPLVLNSSGSGPHSTNNTSSFTPNSQIINRPVVSTSSPLINHRHPISSPHSHHSFVHGGAPIGGPPPFASPSPILRNPRYQYITSSNQNSPVLNVPKRINVPLNAYPHSVNPNGLGGSPMISFSPVPLPPHSSSQSQQQQRSNSFANHVSPNLNSTNHRPLPRNRNRSESVGYDIEYDTQLQQQQQQQAFHNSQTNGMANGNIPSSSVHVSLNQSHSFSGAGQNHYYSSPIIPPRQGKSNPHHNAYFGEISESPQGFRQRYHQNYSRSGNGIGNGNFTNHNDLPFPLCNGAGVNKIAGSPQERIYETVDSDDDDDVYVSDEEGDGNGGEFEFDMSVSVPYSSEDLYNGSHAHHHHHNAYNGGYTHKSHRSNASAGQTQSHNSQAQNQSQSRAQHHPRSKRSKKSLPVRPTPPARKVPTNLPMMLGTYLSETETRLLEDRKYKQLINEAEALLKEISLENDKTKPWSGRPDSLRHEDCPQSDPLRRKAYDCWALRRLQQELAGCCASPPVLHRSRLNLTSPSSPNASSHPYLNHNLSLVQVHSDVEFMNALTADKSRNNSNF